MTFESLMEDELFQDRVYQAKDLGEVISLFSEAGVEISEKDLLDRILPSGQELSEKELENVAGGRTIMSFFRSILKGGSFGSGGKMGGR